MPLSAQSTATVQHFSAKGGDTVLAATTRGIYISSDGGVSYSPYGLDTLDVTAILVDSAGYILASTYSNYGVLKSTDNGNTWIISGLTNQYAVNHLIKAGDGSILAASHEDFIWRSTDKGVSWYKVSTLNLANRVYQFTRKPDGTVLSAHLGGVSYSTNAGISWEFLLGSQGQTFCVSASGSYIYTGKTAAQGLFRTSNYGQTWDTLHNGIPVTTFMSVLAFDSIVLAGTFNAGMYRSTDYGNSWQPGSTAMKGVFALYRHSSGKLFAGTDSGAYYSTNNGTDWHKSGLLTGLPEEAEHHTLSFSLSQNYPNPFNPMTRIEFTLAKPSKVKLMVYSITGELAATLLEKELPAGEHQTDFNAGALPSGIYLYPLMVDGYVSAGKMILQK